VAIRGLNQPVGVESKLAKLSVHLRSMAPIALTVEARAELDGLADQCEAVAVVGRGGLEPSDLTLIKRALCPAELPARP
jgi:hypothetical protein